MLAAALELAAKGVPVFPCLPKGKNPLTAHGFKDRTTDPAIIAAWWAANPDANIGLVPGDRDRTVIDLDGTLGAENWAIEWGEFSKTYTVRTPSGGRHLYFAGTLDTNRKLAPGIDIRSTRGYVLAPPSIVEYPDGKVGRYEVESEDPALPLPEGIRSATKATPERKPADGPESCELDEDATIAWAKKLLAKDLAEHGEPVEGEASDVRTHALIGTLRDGPRWGKSLSDDTIAELLHNHWAPHFDYEWIETKVTKGSWQLPRGCGQGGSADRYYGDPAQYAEYRPRNAGESIRDAETRREKATEEVPEDGKEAARQKRIRELAEQFKGIDPIEAIKMPPPRYWDKERLLIRTYGGSVNMIYAEFSNFKTTWAIGHSLHTAKVRACRILYIVGEGAHGFGPKTLQAAVKDWNDTHPVDPMTDDWLRAHLHLIPKAPMLLSADEVDALIFAHKEWNPDLVFIDTLGSSVPGEKISEPNVGTAIGARTRYLAAAFRADTFLVHHTGKDASRGAMGSQYFVNDPDMVLALDHDKDAQSLCVTVEKDRWGDKDRKVFVGTRGVQGLKVHNRRGELVREDGAFVAVYPLTSEEQTTAAQARKANGKTTDPGLELTLKMALADLNPRDWGQGYSNVQLAEQLTIRQLGKEPPEGTKEHGDWRDVRADWLKKLRNARRSDWTEKYGSEHAPEGSLKKSWRWHLRSQRPVQEEQGS